MGGGFVVEQQVASAAFGPAVEQQPGDGGVGGWGVGLAGGGDEDPVEAAVGAEVQELLDASGGAGGTGDDECLAAGVGFGLGAVDDHGPDGVLEAGDHQSEGVGGGGAQAAGDAIGLVPQLFHGLADPLAGFLTCPQGRVVVEHSGDEGTIDTCPGGNVSDGNSFVHPPTVTTEVTARTPPEMITMASRSKTSPVRNMRVMGTIPEP